MSFAATWMDLEFVILSKVIQTEKDKISFEIACMWNIKKMVQMGGDGGVLNWAIGIDMYTLMCIKLMTD